jgi:DNA-binding response OmpR family regulator
MLPVHDGSTVVRRLRDELGLRVPCIMVSAVAAARDNWRAWGADDFLAKPFDLESLIGVVKRAASRDARLWTQDALDTSDERAS